MPTLFTISCDCPDHSNLAAPHRLDDLLCIAYFALSLSQLSWAFIRVVVYEKEPPVHPRLFAFGYFSRPSPRFALPRVHMGLTCKWSN